MDPREGIERTNRGHLDALHRSMRGPFTAVDAAAALQLELPRTRRLLSYLAARGWLSRVRQGLYVTVPLGATAPSLWREDPWVVAQSAFEPCYMAGWSAFEHWGLTDQLYGTLCVATGASIRQRTVIIQETTYRLVSVPVKRHFGTFPVWRGQVRVSVSDPSRTVVDILSNPALGGGIRHASEVVMNYLGGEHRAVDRLLGYAQQLGNRGVYKRLGFLIEALGLEESDLSLACRGAKSAGIALLDPALDPAGPIVTRWNLRVNATLPRPDGTR